jgi:hypothetical protein
MGPGYPSSHNTRSDQRPGWAAVQYRPWAKSTTWPPQAPCPSAATTHPGKLRRVAAPQGAMGVHRCGPAPAPASASAPAALPSPSSPQPRGRPCTAAAAGRALAAKYAPGSWAPVGGVPGWVQQLKEVRPVCCLVPTSLVVAQCCLRGAYTCCSGAGAGGRHPSALAQWCAQWCARPQCSAALLG